MGGASQPALPVHVVDVNVGSFNMGMDQIMLSRRKHTDNIDRVVGAAFEMANLHLGLFCEVGGHKKGLRDAGIEEAGEYLGRLLDRDDIDANSEQAYLTVWQTAGKSPPRWQTASSPKTSDIALALKKVNILEQDSSTPLEPQLYLAEFTVTSYLHPGLDGVLTPRYIAHPYAA